MYLYWINLLLWELLLFAALRLFCFENKSLKEPPLDTFPTARFKIFVDGQMTTILAQSEIIFKTAKGAEEKLVFLPIDSGSIFVDRFRRSRRNWSPCRNCKQKSFSKKHSVSSLLTSRTVLIASNYSSPLAC